jgi:hypothetical protein
MRSQVAVAIQVLFVALASLFVAGTTWSEPGRVLSEQKISDTQGNFPATLQREDEFGGSVVSLGDLDGPGPSVVAVAAGATGDDDGGGNRGAAYILFLDSAGSVLSYQKISDTEGNFTATLENADDFGAAVAYLGDLDGAGPSVAALAIGAAADDDGGTNRGAVYVLFLDSTGSVLTHQKISDTEGNFTGTLDNADEFGGALAGLGDLDGPGPSAAALAVGVTGDDDGGLSRGAVYVLLLDSSGSVLSHQKISDTESNFTGTLENIDDFGSSVAHLGDLDGAGPSAATLAVGAIGDDDGGPDRGAVWLLYLDGAGQVLSHKKISQTQGNFTQQLDNLDEFGNSVTLLGDLDGAGPSPVAMAVGTIGDDDGGSGHGAVYVLLLDDSENVLSYQKISSTEGNFTGPLSPGDEFGGAVAGVGDLDGGGPSALTLVVGCTFDDDGGEDHGAVYVLLLEGDPTTAVQLSDFDGTLLREGVLLSWRFPEPFRAQVLSASVQRSASVEGPFATIATGLQPARSMTYLDAQARRHEPLWYRLDLTMEDGTRELTNVIQVDANPSEREMLELSAFDPGPGQSVALVYRVANRTSHVRLSIFDVQGRLGRAYHERMLEPGQYVRAWDRLSTSGARTARGVYVIRLQAGDLVETQKLTLLHE